MSGDSETSDDDEYEKLKSAVDPDFKLFEEGQTTKLTSNGKPKSNRKETSEGEAEQKFNAGHFVHPLRLTPDNQKFVAKHLAEALDKNIKISKKKRIVQNDAVAKADNEGILLFSNSTRRITATEVKKASQLNNKKTKSKSKQTVPIIKKRKIDNDSSSEDEDDKLKSVAVSSDWVLNPKTL